MKIRLKNPFVKINLLFKLLILLIVSPNLLFSQWLDDEFSNSKHFFNGASNESFIVFAGGNTIGFTPNDDIDIYNIEFNAWIQLKMSSPRADPAVALHNDILYIAGGVNLGTLEESDVIDIINLNTLEQTVDQLSQPRHDISILSYENEVFFAGGSNTTFSSNIKFCPIAIIDVLNTTDNTWSIMSMPTPRAGLASISLLGKLYFAGGVTSKSLESDLVEIFDVPSGTWTTDQISEPRIFPAITTHNDKIYIAGGNNTNNDLSTVVDILDIKTNTWETDNLSMGRTLIEAVVACDKIYFIGGSDIDFTAAAVSNSFNHVDIYDPLLDTWSADEIINPRTWFGAATSNNNIIIAGGWDPSGVGLVGTIEKMVCEEIVSNVSHVEENLVDVYPNPISEFDLMNIESKNELMQSITVTDLMGKVILRNNIQQEKKYQLKIPSYIPSGLYLIKLKLADNREIVQKIIKS